MLLLMMYFMYEMKCSVCGTIGFHKSQSILTKCLYNIFAFTHVCIVINICTFSYVNALVRLENTIKTNLLKGK